MQYWYKQTKDKPLFPDLLWSRPEHRRAAGKLLVVGGNLHGFAAPAEAYQKSLEAGIGTAKVLLPDALKKTIGSVLENGEFAPSTPSGSFSQKALSELLEYAKWADAVLFAGDLGRNSETTVLLEKFLLNSRVKTALTKDAIDNLINNPAILVDRTDAVLVLTMAELQHIVRALPWPKAVTFNMPLMQLVELLHELTASHPAHLVLKHGEVVVVASNGKVGTTPVAGLDEMWRVKTAAQAIVWWLQNPSKTFEALTTAVLHN